MSKQFTVDDIVEVSKACWMMGVEAFWINILFKGCKNPVEFYAAPTANNEFGREMYERLKNKEFGDLHHGFGEYYRTQPKEQPQVEEEAIAKRNQLLLESDWSDLPARQAAMNDSQKAAWANYRQVLRDITKQQGFPWDPEWPAKP